MSEIIQAVLRMPPELFWTESHIIREQHDRRRFQAADEIDRLRAEVEQLRAVQGKPMAWVTADTVVGQRVNGKPRRVWWENDEGVGTPIYTTHQHEKQQREEPTPSEAVYAFAAWLTTRDNAVTIGSTHDASKVAELVSLFVDSQGWELPRDDYTDRLRAYPAEASQDDYDQLEQRIMSIVNLSDCEELLNALEKGKDVHKATAAEVFGVTPENVTDDMRRSAKAINFGLIYGMPALELARHQPCGCVVCYCEHETQCQGCGAKHCGTHPVGQFPAPAYLQSEPDVEQDDYETWYEEAIIASNNADFAGMSAAQVIEYQDGEIKCLRADVSALVKALSALRGCIVETRGPDAHSALELADAALATYPGVQPEPVKSGAVEAVTKAIMFEDSGSTEDWRDNTNLGKAAIKAMHPEIQKWRNDIAEQAAQIAERYEVNPHCVTDIRALAAYRKKG